jgi:2-iminobutanoate/2-iminopropanoate deaminase
MSGGAKKIVHTDAAPSAIGPYSQAVIAGGVVYCSGQIAINSSSGELVTGGVAEQTRLVLNNLKAVLEAAGSGMEQVVKAGVFLKDLSDFNEMNGVYAEFFPENPPARACVEVSRLPKDVDVEIDCIALVKA